MNGKKKASKLIPLMLILTMFSAVALGAVYFYKTLPVTGTLKAGADFKLFPTSACTGTEKITIVIGDMFYGMAGQTFEVWIKNTGTTSSNVHWKDTLAITGMTATMQYGVGVIPVTSLTGDWTEDTQTIVLPAGQSIYARLTITPPSTPGAEIPISYTLTFEARDS